MPKPTHTATRRTPTATLPGNPCDSRSRATPTDLPSTVTILIAALSGPPSSAWAGAGLIPSLLLLLGGLILWVAGGRLLKSGVVLVGLGLGGLIGLLLGSLVGLSGPGSLIGGLIGAMIGGITGWMFFRAAAAVCFALALGLACAVVGLAIAGSVAGQGAQAHAALVALSSDDPSPDPEPEDLPTGLGGGEQPVVAPPERPRLPDEPIADPGPNPGESEEPATAPNPRTVDPKIVNRPPANAKPAAPAKPAADARPQAPRRAEPAGPERKTTTKAPTKEIAKAAPKPQPAGNSQPNGASSQGGRGLGTTTSTLGYIDVNAPALGAEDLQEASRAIGGTLSRWWRSVPSVAKGWVIGLGLLGALAGGLAGLFMPTKAASILTSAAGAALWPAGALSLAEALNLSWPKFSMMPPLAWVMTWVVLTFVGVAIQASGGRSTRATSAKVAKKAAKG